MTKDTEQGVKNLFYTDHTLLPWLALKYCKLLSFRGSATACYKMEK